jgi:hypothetical protein
MALATRPAPMRADRSSARSEWRPPRWVVPLFALAALVLVPWIVLLVHELPSAHRASHWDIAWAGFDGAMAFLLLAVAVAAWRRSPWLEGTATAAATLLFVDAWFDVLTSSTRTELVIAAIEAVLVEVPLAVLSRATPSAASSRRSCSSAARRRGRPAAGTPGFAVPGSGLRLPPTRATASAQRYRRRRKVLVTA